METLVGLIGIGSNDDALANKSTLPILSADCMAFKRVDSREQTARDVAR
jgi:hypothetical protein